MRRSRSVNVQAERQAGKQADTCHVKQGWTLCTASDAAMSWQLVGTAVLSVHTPYIHPLNRVKDIALVSALSRIGCQPASYCPAVDGNISLQFNSIQFQMLVFHGSLWM